MQRTRKPIVTANGGAIIYFEHYCYCASKKCVSAAYSKFHCYCGQDGFKYATHIQLFCYFGRSSAGTEHCVSHRTGVCSRFVCACCDSVHLV